MKVAITRKSRNDFGSLECDKKIIEEISIADVMQSYLLSVRSMLLGW